MRGWLWLRVSLDYRNTWGLHHKSEEHRRFSTIAHCASRSSEEFCMAQEREYGGNKPAHGGCCSGECGQIWRDTGWFTVMLMWKCWGLGADGQERILEMPSVQKGCSFYSTVAGPWAESYVLGLWGATEDDFGDGRGKDKGKFPGFPYVKEWHKHSSLKVGWEEYSELLSSLTRKGNETHFILVL